MKLEDDVQSVLARVFARVGRLARAHPVPGVALGGVAYVQGRVLLGRAELMPPRRPSNQWQMLRANIAPFLTIKVPLAAVRVEVGDDHQDVRTDRQGYFTARLETSHLAAGVYPVRATCLQPAGISAETALHVADPNVDFVVVSDIDDTIVDSGVAHGALTTLKTVFLTDASTRVPLSGAPGLYRALAHTAEGKPDRPFVYLSTSPWNLAAFLQSFLERHDFPGGSMVLTDIGPGRHGRFRIRGRDHKLGGLRQLADGAPRQRFILLGDSGQADAEIYAAFAMEYPGRVAAVYIREAGRSDPERSGRLAHSVNILQTAGIPCIVADNSDAFADHARSAGFIASER